MRVMVCDDHALMARLLADRLREQRYDVVVTTSPEQAVDAQRAEPADVCVVDLVYPQSSMDGAQATERLLALSCRTKVLLLTAYPGSEVARRAMAAGAHALLDKSTPLPRVVSSIGRLGVGEPVGRKSLVRGARPMSQELTGREIEVLALLVRGCSTAQVATGLGIQVNTARKHVQRLLEKLGVRSRLEVVAIAVRRGLVPTARDADAPPVMAGRPGAAS